MERQKRWQLLVIIAVVLLTIYNILPTVFYYRPSLKNPIDQETAQDISQEISSRINSLEDDAQKWIHAFLSHINISPLSVATSKEKPHIIEVLFKNNKDTETFKRLLPQAGELIPFVPSRLSLSSLPSDDPQKKVLIERNIDVHFSPENPSQDFKFSPKKTSNGEISDFYREVIYDRAARLASAFTASSNNINRIDELTTSSSLDSRSSEEVLLIAQEINLFSTLFTHEKGITERYFSTFFMDNTKGRSNQADKLTNLFKKTDNELSRQKKLLIDEQEQLTDSGMQLPFEKERQLSLLNSQLQTLEKAIKIVRTQQKQFDNSPSPLSQRELLAQLKQSQHRIESQGSLQALTFQGRNPFFQELFIDWDSDKLILEFYPEVNAILQKKVENENDAYLKERTHQLVINTIALASRKAGEELKPDRNGFSTNLNLLTNSSSILALDLGNLSQKSVTRIHETITNQWTPSFQDLEHDVFPIVDYTAFQNLPPEQQKLSLLVFAPVNHSEDSFSEGFHSDAIYVVARGLISIQEKFKNFPDSPEAKAFMDDFRGLVTLLRNHGFVGYPGSIEGFPENFDQDFIFEKTGYYHNLLKASREKFSVHGSNRYAILEMTDKEQRVLTLNAIDQAIHEDLMKWRDEYYSAQVDLDLRKKYLVPPVSKSVLWDNFKLNCKKYFRGDERKILKWGLDLSGGKMVRIGLKDENNQPVTDIESLNQAVNELTKRVNNMGLAEVNIRVEGANIVLDFPGSQGFSGSDLVKASSMYFHVVNENFSTANPTLSKTVTSFLQNVWNEAVVTNRKDIESINEIAWQHLGGDPDSGLRPRSEEAKLLLEHNLRLAHPNRSVRSSTFDDTLSTIAMFKGEGPSEWQGQNNPLLIVFHNYALEGSDLATVQPSYDPEKGNILSFEVASSYAKKEKTTGSPRDDLLTWTTPFSEENIAGTAKETSTGGRGWRMAIILNGEIVSAPTLNQPLNHRASIYGKFTQREVNKLSADLKAGSLTFTPTILSENNISADLGSEERSKGILSAAIGLFLVVAIMVLYYRFGGVVASVAVIFNLLIMWGVLQNLDAALTLAGIGGIILTVGMAVDANVLVFERIREEFSHSGRLATSVQAGYRKAFSAIIDSNVTTVIAALILMQSDSGPIKGFALTIIIGILSSMFTALFMTRYFFAGWVQNPKNKRLNMSKLVDSTSFNFLSKSKIAFIISLITIVSGSYFLTTEKNTLLGMDFTGGHALTMQFEESEGKDYRALTLESLKREGADEGNFLVRELNKPNHLRLQFGRGMELEGEPFYQMPINSSLTNFQYAYENNPRIAWVVNSLEKSGLTLNEERLENLDQNWVAVSGQFSDVMRNNALWGLGIAMVCILIYITFRFEFKFAVSAIIGLVHDVLISLALVGILHKLGVPVQINLETIAAIMMIIGYSLNDTIIIFDRIREDSHIYRKKNFIDIVNHSLNATLGRTTLTSFTTLIVLLSLLIFGGSLIFDFALVMTIGVILGTLSSLFVVSPIMLYFHNRELSYKEAKAT